MAKNKSNQRSPDSVENKLGTDAHSLTKKKSIMFSQRNLNKIEIITVFYFFKNQARESKKLLEKVE